ncbi:MAG: glycosyltransferase family 4 protein [Verrucomicrobiota bacterium]
MDALNPRICYVSDERFPSRWTDTQQIVKTATALSDEGANVDLVLPRRFSRTFFAGPAARRQEVTSAYGVTPLFELTQIPTVPAGATRLEKITHGIAAPLYALFSGHDVVYTRNVVSLTWALLLGKAAVFESHRVLKQHYPVSYRFIRWARRFPRFLGVVTNARFIAEAYRQMGFSEAQVTIVHNAFDPADMEPRLDRMAARKQIGLVGSDGEPERRAIVCYAGHIQKRKGIDTVIELAARLPETLFLICGGFPADVAAAEQSAAARGATNLHFTGWIDVARLAPYLYAADVLLIPPTRAPLEKHGNTVLPIKTYTYLAAGRVIVAPRLPDVEEVLTDGANALLVPPDDLDGAVAAIRGVLADPPLAARLGAAALTRQNDFTWRARARQIRAFLARRLAVMSKA